MIPLKDQEKLKLRFARDLTSRVRVDFFTEKPSPIFVPGKEPCAACDDVHKLLRELAGLNLRISLTVHDLGEDAETAGTLGVDKVPAIVLRGVANRPIRYFGNPVSHQFASFVELLLLIARGTPNLQDETTKTLRRLRSDVAMKLFVTPNCAHSPAMVLLAARMLLASPRLALDIIDPTLFPALLQRYPVRATPLVTLNDTFGIFAAMDEATLAQGILAAAQGQQPPVGGDPKKLTPLVPPRRASQPTRRPASSGGLILPR